MTQVDNDIVSQRASELVARTVEIDHVPDLVAFAGDDGLLWHEESTGLAGVGEALRIPLPGGLRDREGVAAVSNLLRGICVDNEVGVAGCGPVAFGALPFDPSAAGYLVVPAHLVGYRGGRGWLTTITVAEEPPPTAADLVSRPASVDGRASPDGFALSSLMPHGAWRQLIAEAVAAIGQGWLDKVVLARRVDVTANQPIVVAEVLSRLVALYPSCMVYSMDGFVGASPELLIRRTGREVVSHPLAGTVARSGDSAADEALVAGLLASAKDRREHQFVIDTLAGTLGSVCEILDVPPTPTVMGLRNVSHLGTPITGRLRAAADPAGVPTALELVARIHPTPAVAGTPTGAAIEYLQEVEGFDRGRYAGPVGWVDASGDGAWAIGIRCAEVDGHNARLFAGVGVVDGSDPSAELAETQLKLQALLAAVVRP